MADITIASLFEQAAGRLRSDFEFVRSSNPHAGEKGQEVEEILKTFLNKHLPKRWHVDSGVVIDFDDHLSRQCDVIVYDAVSAPLYRAAERMNILPLHNVAAVCEVKSTLNRRELEDAYAKIASVKSLKQLPTTGADKDSTDSGAGTLGVLGIVFAFSSDVKLQTLAETMADLNKKSPSHLWPDMVVVLDVGVITYAVQWPGATGMSGHFLSHTPFPGQTYGPPPWYVHLCTNDDGAKALNRCFLLLLTHLNFFPLRSGVPPFNRMLGASQTLGMSIAAYQYDLGISLHPAPPELYNINNPRPRFEIRVSGSDGTPLASLQYIPWQNGAAVRKQGPLPLSGLLLLVAPKPGILALRESSENGRELSTVFALSEEEFKSWPSIIEAKAKNMKAVLVDHQATKP